MLARDDLFGSGRAFGDEATAPARAGSFHHRASASAAAQIATTSVSGPNPEKPPTPSIQPPRPAAPIQPMLEPVTFQPITVPRTEAGTRASDAIIAGRARALRK